MKILKFYADWCNPCKALEEMLKTENVEHENINIESDEGNTLTSTYKIKSIPTLIKVDNENKEIDRLVGLPPTLQILKQFCN